jgi:hypothetical protein
MGTCTFENTRERAKLGGVPSLWGLCRLPREVTVVSDLARGTAEYIADERRQESLDG